MQLINVILLTVMKRRIQQMEFFMKHPEDVQNTLLFKLLAEGRFTEYGKKYRFQEIKTYKDFANQVPINTYEVIFPYILRMMKGEQNVLWPSEIRWFAKSSGTTNSRSKFIPVSSEALKECHFQAGKDIYSLYVNNHPDTKIFSGKGLAIGGSNQLNELDPNSNSYYGDVSAVIMKNLPPWAEFIRTPSLEVALMKNWEDKIERLAKDTASVNVTHIAGVPTWTVLLLKRIMEIENKKVSQFWPNLEVFFHGAVSFSPYRKLFKSLIPENTMRYWETYNASEGFFGIQESSDADDLLLMLDYGIFYEFIRVDRLEDEHPKVTLLEDVEVGINYVLLITSNSGLWRYNLGDTVKFTSKSPYRIKITGRTKHFINAFGEEVIIENAETAITRASEATGAVINNYTAAPIFLSEKERGGHEWLIEFHQQPNNFSEFGQVLDETLRNINSDYDAKRFRNLALGPPKIVSLPSGTFYNWMKRRGKLGGQNKVPRLCNTREFVEDILANLENTE